MRLVNLMFVSFGGSSRSSWKGGRLWRYGKLWRLSKSLLSGQRQEGVSDKGILGEYFGQIQSYKHWE
jgi:hypothetical protein